MTKIRVGVLAGGASAERGISLATGYQIAENLPKDRYEVVLLDPLALMTNNPHITLLVCRHGGHCGFVGPREGNDDGYWAENRIVDFAARHARVATRRLDAPAAVTARA